MKNRLTDLNDHLFAAIERLSDEELTQEQIEQEAKRAEAMVDVADAIVGNAKLQLDAAKFLADYGVQPSREDLPMLGAPASQKPADRKLTAVPQR